ncbi:hypothetical protein [Heliorestis convoluta]|uniref:Uncharacterized protein n=1 Tax=Heliorestis convoluta TaxID=356322 RepID=A0A5Q2N261_9FIRM|nr:hypothetical protein [Heliorestis convoluta]QGG46635.1 hypothetical protein FTV88_0456 [Heliorestis convoluta]
MKQWAPKILKTIGFILLLWGFFAGFQVLGSLDEVKEELGITEEVLMEAEMRGEEILLDDEPLRELAMMMWFYVIMGVMAFIFFYGGAVLLQKTFDSDSSS